MTSRALALLIVSILALGFAPQAAATSGSDSFVYIGQATHLKTSGGPALCGPYAPNPWDDSYTCSFAQLPRQSSGTTTTATITLDDAVRAHLTFKWQTTTPGGATICTEGTGTDTATFTVPAACRVVFLALPPQATSGSGTFSWVIEQCSPSCPQ